MILLRERPKMMFSSVRARLGPKQSSAVFRSLSH